MSHKLDRSRPLWQPEEQPTPSQLATMAISNQVKIPQRALGAIHTSVNELRETGSKAKEIVAGVVAYRRPTAMPLEVSLNGPIRPHRAEVPAAARPCAAPPMNTSISTPDLLTRARRVNTSPLPRPGRHDLREAV